MKKLFFIGVLVCSVSLIASGQNEPQSTGRSPINRDNLMLRPNSRDYNIIRKGNNHQRIIQMRTQSMVRHKQALLNRKVSMEHRRSSQQQQMMRQQQMRQRMLHRRGMHR